MKKTLQNFIFFNFFLRHVYFYGLKGYPKIFSLEKNKNRTPANFPRFGHQLSSQVTNPTTLILGNSGFSLYSLSKFSFCIKSRSHTLNPISILEVFDSDIQSSCPCSTIRILFSNIGWLVERFWSQRVRYLSQPLQIYLV